MIRDRRSRTPTSTRPRSSAIRVLDTILFSSLAVAVVAATLTLAADVALSAASGASADWGHAVRGSLLYATALSFCGAFAVYNIDRVRDLERDLAVWPLRSQFVTRHRRPLTAAAALAGTVGAAAALKLPLAAIGLCAAILVLGLAHRRLKARANTKIVYVTLAWLAVVLAIPALSHAPAAPSAIAWIAAIYAAAIGANLIVTSRGDPESEPNAEDDAAANDSASRTYFGFGPLAEARFIAGIGTVFALLGPAATRPLACVPAAELVALLAYRRREHYLLGVVDGALAAGAIAALALMLR